MGTGVRVVHLQKRVEAFEAAYTGSQLHYPEALSLRYKLAPSALGVFPI